MSTEKGRKDRRWREVGSRISLMTSETDTNLSAKEGSLSPPWIMALASTMATAMPLADLQVSKSLVGVFGGCGGVGEGVCFTMFDQHTTGGSTVGGASGVDNGGCESIGWSLSWGARRERDQKKGEINPRRELGVY